MGPLRRPLGNWNCVCVGGQGNDRAEAIYPQGQGWGASKAEERASWDRVPPPGGGVFLDTPQGTTDPDVGRHVPFWAPEPLPTPNSPVRLCPPPSVVWGRTSKEAWGWGSPLCRDQPGPAGVAKDPLPLLWALGVPVAAERPPPPPFCTGWKE